MTTKTFTYTGGTQAWVVPSGVTSVDIDAYGAAGAAGAGGDGLGGEATGTLAVTPGETLTIYVGGAGSGSTGGWNGGGNGGLGGVGASGGGGGGATDIRQGGTALSNRVLVAAGGGGGGYGVNAGKGGAGGGLTGTAGTDPSGNNVLGGGGGTQTAGGAAAYNSPPGSLGVGSAGAGSSGQCGGGGGGGYYGGAAGGYYAGTPEGGGGGGGGSSYIGGVTSGTTTGNAHSGAGSIVLTWAAPPNAPLLQTPTTNQTIAGNEDNTFSWQFSSSTSGDVQTQADIQWWDRDSSGARIGSAHTHTVTGSAAQWIAVAGTFTDGDKEWQARCYNSVGPGPWSSSGFFTVGTRPSLPVWQDPINGQTIPTSSYTGTVTVDAGTTVTEWTLYADNNGSIGTGTILQGPVTLSSGDITKQTFSGFTNGQVVWWSVRAQSSGLWSQPAQIRTPVSYTPPAAPQVTLTPDAANGVLIVGITNPAPSGSEPATSYNNVYVDDGKGKGKERVATNLPTNQPWTYPWPVSLRDYTGNLWVEAVGTNGVTAETTA